MTTPDLSEIVKGLTDSQKRAILEARDVGPFFVVDFISPWPSPVAQFLTLKTDRLTQLGYQVRALLQGQQS